MKAFLSDVHYREDIWPNDNIRAIDEAKRILVETENGGIETFTYGHHRFEGTYVKTELSRAYDGIGHKELAEALAAFVASDDPEGYLITDQPMAG